MLIAVAIVLMLQPDGSTYAANKRGKLSEATIQAGDREREYLLYTPPGTANAETLPLVIVFHGGGGTAKGIAREVGSSLHKIADAEKFFVAYPNAVNKMWDFGSGQVSESFDEHVDDRAFFAALLDELIVTRAIDVSRVFATGISRGGQASYFLACSFPDRVRAIAPVAMPLPEFMQPVCADTRGVGLALLNGTDDPLVPYDGGQITVGRRARGAVMSTDATIAYWREMNGCSAEPPVRETMNDARDRMQVEKSSWLNCMLAPVILYRIDGGGHTWPSGRQYLPRVLVGRVNRDIDGAAEAWSFFSQFPALEKR